jgi:integrase/recombinase XerD
MSRAPKMQLPRKDWPEDDRKRWRNANKSGIDVFDDGGPAAHLAEPSRQVLQQSYARFLGFIAANRSQLLTSPPEARVDRGIIGDYVAFRRQSCSASGMAIDLHHLRLALRFICPTTDWSWLLTITKRITTTARRRSRKYHLVTSERLYALGLALMDTAISTANGSKGVSKSAAFQYRDGLIIVLAALFVPRKRTLAALCVGKHLVRTGDLWALEIPPGDTKSRRPLDCPIGKEASARIHLYLERFRSRIPGASSHSGLWPSNQGAPMCAGAIYDAVRKRTRKAFGFGVNLHRFRHAAASLWSIQDPANVRGVKDLLGQASFDITEKHYIMAQSRIAGRTLARVVDLLRK